MPFRSMAREGVLTSADLDVLQEIYDAATVDIDSVDDTTMADVMRSLITHYQTGLKDRQALIAMAKRNLHGAAG